MGSNARILDSCGTSESISNNRLYRVEKRAVVGPSLRCQVLYYVIVLSSYIGLGVPVISSNTLGLVISSTACQFHRKNVRSVSSIKFPLKKKEIKNNDFGHLILRPQSSLTIGSFSLILSSNS